MKNKNNKLTLEEAIEVAKISKTKKQFIFKHHSLYIKALKENWMPTLEKYLEDHKHKLKDHSFEECKEKALLYKTSTDFFRNEPSYWRVANRKGWISLICSHMKNNVIKKNKIKKLVKDVSDYKVSGFWTLERAISEIKKHNYQSKRDILLNNQPLYAAIVRNSWKNEIPIKWSNNRHTKYTKEFCAKIAKKYNKIKEFQNGDRTIYWAAKNKGWLQEICSHIIKNELHSKAGLSPRSSNWSDDELLKEFKKYTKVSDVQKYSRNQYYAAYRRGPVFFEQCKSHFSFNNKKTPKYSDDFLKTRSLAYSSRYEFYKAETNVYQAIIKRNLHHFLDHMPKQVNASPTEKSESHSEFMQKLLKLNLDDIQYEKALDGSIPDFTLFKKNKVLVVEIKCDKQIWSITELEEQIERYNNTFKNYYQERLIYKPILTSKSGKYGISFEEAINLIKNLFSLK